MPLLETTPQAPVNPYAVTKYCVERMIKDFAHAYGMSYVLLRYFNAAGADSEGELGERHNPESHLVPLILQAASGRRDNIKVFGSDYETEDGSCVRDYVHINDICHAHLLALKKMQANNTSAAFNLGNGTGFSVKKVIDVTKQVTAKDFTVIEADRRDGDPAVLVADSTLAKQELNWKPEFNQLETIIETAWNWEVSFLMKQ